MESWQKTTLILCAFGLLKELRPSESFITEYFIGFKNVTAEDVIHDLYPIATYTILTTSFIAFLVTDLLRYRSVVVFQGVSYVICWITLIFGQKYVLMQAVEVLYGIAISADVAYYTYIYAQVDRSNYRKVTSYTYTAGLVGKLLASLSAQILVSFRVLNFHQLIYITLFTAIGALLVSCFLPSVNKSIYFNRSDEDEENESSKNLQDSPQPHPPENTISFIGRLKKAYKLLWIDFKDSYSKTYVLKWSIWWTIAYAGNMQILNYTQSLWERIDSYTDTDIYNGGVGAVQCVLSALLTFGVGHMKIQWSKWGEGFLCFTSIIQGLILILMSQTNSLYVAYSTYILFRVLYQLVISIASSEVAQGIAKDSCGLIFGINTFMALVIQTVLTIVVTDKRGLALDERTQFVIYGSYFLVLGFIFIVTVTSTVCKNLWFNSSKMTDCKDDLGDYEKAKCDKEEPETSLHTEQ